MADPTNPPVELPGAFSLLSPSWAAIKLNGMTFIEFLLIEGIIQIMSTVFVSKHAESVFMVNLLTNVISFIIAPALVILRLRSVRGEKVDLSVAVRDGLQFVVRYFLLSLCIGFVVILGLILFIVPGIIMIRRYYLAPFYLVDRDMGVIEAMRASAADSKQFSSSIYGVMGVMFLFALLCVVLVGFVLLFMYYCADAIRYQQITAAVGDKK